MEPSLQITRPPAMADRIVGYHLIRNAPFNMSDLGLNSEIRIAINNNDTYAPFDSYLSLVGKVNKGASTETLRIINNGFAHLFDTVTYRINGADVDQVRNPGIVSTLKGLISFREADLNAISNSGISNPNSSFFAPDSVYVAGGAFNVCIPLRYWMGFFEDENRVVTGVSQELVLTRSSNDLNVFKGSATHKDVSIVLEKVYWVVPAVKLADKLKLEMYLTTKKDPPLPLVFRGWEFHENPAVPNTTSFTWPIKTCNQLQKPRYVIAAFYKNKKNDITKNISLPDTVPIQSFRLFLNNEQFPFQEQTIDLKNAVFGELYDSYIRFQQSYYNWKHPSPLLTREKFKESPIICIDCSKQEDSVKEGAVDVRLEFQFSESLPSDTSCVAIIIHDKLVSYTPITGHVQRY